MKTVVMVVLGFLVMVSGAWAQETAGSRYCTLPSGPGPGGTGADVLAAIKKCRAGDVIMINRRTLFVIARVCDFSKSMVAVADDVICVLGTERPQTQ